MRVSRRTQVARWGGALLVALAPLPWVGLGSASAGESTVYATVDGHEEFSSDANHPDYWGNECKNIEGGSFSSYVLAADYAKVIVKAGSGEFANTIFNDAAKGETVWADTNGDGVFNPGGQDGDKQISHIIVCGGVTPSPSESETTDKPTPSESETTDKPTPSDTESTGSGTPTNSESESPTPTDTESSGSGTPTNSESESPTPTDTESTGSESPTDETTSPGVSPSDETTSPIETGSSQPNTDGPSSASVLPTRLTQGETLPQTGSDVPIGGAVLASMFLIGLGALLLLGPGRLTPEAYRRKH